LRPPALSVKLVVAGNRQFAFAFAAIANFTEVSITLTEGSIRLGAILQGAKKLGSRRQIFLRSSVTALGRDRECDLHHARASAAFMQRDASFACGGY
jgi:hypothetical protein